MSKCGSGWTDRHDSVSAVATGLVAHVVLRFWLDRSPRPFFARRDRFVEMRFWLDRSPRPFFGRRDRFGSKCRFAVLAGTFATVFERLSERLLALLSPHLAQLQLNLSSLTKKLSNAKSGCCLGI